MEQIEEFQLMESEDNILTTEKKTEDVDIQDLCEVFEKINLLVSAKFNTDFTTILQNFLLIAQDEKLG